MSYLKMKKYAQAEADCTAAIALDGKYIKAWMRRATARAGLKRLAEALQDYKKVLQLDPANKVCQSLLSQAERLLPPFSSLVS